MSVVYFIYIDTPFIYFIVFLLRSLLTEDELKQLEEACDMALELNQSKHRIYEYVESRMSFIAPNLSIIVGASTAAKIMGEEVKLSRKYQVFLCPYIFFSYF